MNRAVIISGPLAQDHEFIYPFYRLLEEGFSVDVCIIGGKPVMGILGTTLPPNKNHPVKDIHDIKTDDYDLLVLPGGVKAMEKIRLEKKLINFISEFYKKDKVIACICSGVQLMISAKIVKGKIDNPSVQDLFLPKKRVIINTKKIGINVPHIAWIIATSETITLKNEFHSNPFWLRDSIKLVLSKPL